MTKHHTLVNFKLDSQTDELNYLNQLVGNVNIAVSALKLASDAVGQIISGHQPLFTSTPGEPSAVIKTHRVNLLTRLGQQSTVNLDNFSITNSKRTSHVALHVTGKDLNNLTTEPQTLLSMIQHHISHLMWRIDINPVMAEDFLKFLHLSKGKRT